MGFLQLLTSLILAVSAFSSLALALPAPRAIKPRDYVTEVVTETVWTTVGVTTTVYVDELPSTVTPATSSAETTSAEEVELIPESTSAPPATPPPASPTPAPEPTSEAAVPSVAAGEFAENSVAPPPPPIPTSPAPAAPVVPAYTPPPSPAPEAPAPAPAPVPIIQVVDTSAASSGGSISATCEGGGSSCKGEVTHWDGGLGACGTVVNTESDMAIALPHGLMGTRSNDNPYCNRAVTIRTVSGSTVQAFVKDKCMGCVDRSIDLTNTLFNAVTDGKGDGRVANIEWWFTEASA